VNDFIQGILVGIGIVCFVLLIAISTIGIRTNAEVNDAYVDGTSGAEDRRIRKAMQAHRRRHPRASLDQLMRYENSLRESRERNIRKRGR
jgi:hypothetical protein